MKMKEQNMILLHIQTDGESNLDIFEFLFFK